MNKHVFAKNGKAYYQNTIPDFIRDDSSSIVSQMIRHILAAHKELEIQQEEAWKSQVLELQKRLNACQMEGHIIFEYDIVRLGKRIDVVLLVRKMVFSVEFKNGKNMFVAQDARQAEDYAIDLKNFHKESEDLYVCPILVATEAEKVPKNQSLDCYPDKQVFLQKENLDSLVPKIKELARLYGSDDALDFDRWFNSPYHPTPTIIEAAIEAYKSHDISEIANSEAGQADIDACESAIQGVITYAKEKKKKCICFVTGVPGAGKTLVGLNIVAKNIGKENSNPTVYLSGNGPLVEVLREALVKSAREKTKKIDAKTKESINALIQSSIHFKRANAKTNAPTHENILIFDEAQRVWDADKMRAKHKKDMDLSVSEPHLLYEIMDRHQDWAVIVCLVGLGQDIHDGEVGINEWFRCGIEDFTHWEIYYSPMIFQHSAENGLDVQMIQKCTHCKTKPELHLKTSVRSFRAHKQSRFVDCLLQNNPAEAKDVLNEIFEKYPVYVTRNINVAKEWVRKQVRGTQRCGVLACSSAQRLKPEGIYVAKEIDQKNWFLAPNEDLRSSNMLEIVASEFKVQGLEIDWAVVCWDLDLRRTRKNDNWEYYNFRGTQWQQRKQEQTRRYLVNSYRVLLTRARQGMILFVPHGVDVDIDPTRDKTRYDAIYNYLLSCGIPELKAD